MGRDFDVVKWTVEAYRISKGTVFFFFHFYYFKVSVIKRIILTRAHRMHILLQGEPYYRNDIG